MSKLSRRFSGLFATRKQKKQRAYRRLRTEPLEARTLLAADFLYSLSTNPFDSEDVNGDRQVSPVDVLAVINALNDSGKVAHAEGVAQSGGAKLLDVDVSGDKVLSPLDALMVINALRAEGEGGTPKVAYTPITLATTFAKGSRTNFFDYVNNGSNDQINRDAGSWIADGFVAGDTILISDSGQFVDINVGLVLGQDENGDDVIGTGDADIRVHNNGLYTVQSVTARTITLDRDLITQFPTRARLDGQLVEGDMLFDNTASVFKVIDSVAPGGNFLVGTLVEDLRTMDDDGNPLSSERKGPFSAYVDVLFDSSLAAPTGTSITDVSFFNGLNSQTFADLSTPGLLNDTGGVAFNNPGNAPTGGGLQLIFTTPFHAGNSGGTVVFGTNEADLSPNRDTLMFASNFAIPISEIDFQSAEIDIVADILAVDDGPLSFDQGSTNNTINVLGNDSVASGTGPTITAPVGTTSINGGQLTLVSASSKNGTNYTFTPNAGFSGQTGFTYTISNGQGATDSADVTINVQAAGPTLVISGPTSRTTNEDTAFTLSGFSITDPQATPITVTLSANGMLSQTTLTGDLSTVINALNSVTYTPLANSTASDTITINASAGTLSDSHTVNVTITPVNDPPVNVINGLGTPPAVAVANTGTHTFPSGTFQVTDVDAGNTLSVTLSVLHGTLTLGANTGTSVTMSGTSPLNIGSLVYDPTDGFVGTDTLTITSTDGTATDTDTVTLTVAPPQFPFVTPNTYTSTEGAGTITLTPSPLADDLVDAGATLTATPASGSTTQGGSFTINGSTFTYTPPADPNFFGTDTFTYTIEQDAAHTPSSTGDTNSTGTVTIEIQPVNDGPVNTVPATRQVNEDNTLTFTGANLVSVQDIDAGAGSLTVTLTASNGKINVTGGSGVSNNGSKSVSISGTVTQVNSALGGLTYAPDLNFNGSDTLTISTNDNGNTGGGALTDTDTVNITINPINDAPTIVVPGAQSFFTGFDNRFTSTPNPFQISDVDAGSSNVQVDLTIADGTLTIGSSTGVTVSQNPGGSNGVRLTGSVTNINNALASGVTYRTSTDGNKTLSATVNDLGNSGGGGQLSASATVAVEVLDFVPVDIGGTVFIDHNSDGNRDADEPQIGGVRVFLRGIDFQGNSVDLTAITDAQGNYSFDALRPSGAAPYTITEEQPAFIRSGTADQASLTLDVRGNVIVTNGSLNFGEGSFTPEFSDVWDLFALSDVAPNNSGILFGMQGSQKWSIFTGPGWDSSHFSNPRFTPGANHDSGVLTVYDSNAAQDRTVNVSTQAGNLTYRGNGVDRVYRVIGGSELLGSLSNGANAEAESHGEATTSDATTSGTAFARGVDALFAGGGL